MDIQHLLCDRTRDLKVSGIRRILELGTKLDDPINLSIGQPDFRVPDAIKQAAIDAITNDRNGYTLTQGIPELRARIQTHLTHDLGWSFGNEGDPEVMLTSGTSGGLVLAFLALMGPGDEIIIPDPYFVMYPQLAAIFGGSAVRCATYPDFRMTAERLAPLITDRTKAVLFNSPSNPTGVVSTRQECEDILRLCRERGVLLISDEIYDAFTFSDGLTDTMANAPHTPVCPSPARHDPRAAEDVLVIRGFGKSYGITGWRMGYAAGPKALLAEMAKAQMYTFVCPPSIAQWGSLAAMDADISEHVAEYESRRDMVVSVLGGVASLPTPGGAFYAFVELPEALGLTGTEFCERAIERNVLTIPGAVFSDRDTHIRLSFATRRDKLEQGIHILAEMLEGK